MKRDLPKYVHRKGKSGTLFFEKKNPHGPDVVISLAKWEYPSPEFWGVYTDILNGELTSNNRQTIKAAIASLKKSARFNNLTEKVKKRYENRLLEFADGKGDVLLKTIEAKHINKYLLSYSDRPSSFNIVRAVLSVLFNHAKDLGWIVYNPVDGVTKLVEKADTEEGQREPWTDSEIEAFHSVAPDRERFVLELLLNTGQRFGDVLNMKWSQVSNDPQGGLGIYVRQQKTRKPLHIPFSPRMLQAFKDFEHILDKNDIYIVKNDRHPNKQISQTAINKFFNAAKKKCNIKKTQHDLRHTCAHMLAAQGLNSEFIMAVTGHGSERMVRRYCDATAQKVRAAEAMSKLKSPLNVIGVDSVPTILQH